MQLPSAGKDEWILRPQDSREQLYTFPKEAGEVACLVAVSGKQWKERRCGEIGRKKGRKKRERESQRGKERGGRRQEGWEEVERRKEGGGKRRKKEREEGKDINTNGSKFYFNFLSCLSQKAKLSSNSIRLFFLTFPCNVYGGNWEFPVVLRKKYRISIKFMRSCKICLQRISLD